MAIPAGRARPLGPTLTASLALHLGALILLLVTIQHRPERAEQIPPADFAMVFEGHSPRLNTGPNPALKNPSQPGSPAPSVTAPPIPSAPPTPAVPPVAAIPPPPPPPPPQASTEAHPTPAPPVPPVAKVPPTVPAPAPTPLAMAIPRPPPIPAAPAPPEAQPPAPSRPERRPERGPAFPTPLAFSLGPPGGTAPNNATQRSALPREPSRLARPGQPSTIDLSFGPIAGGSLSPSSSVKMEGVDVSTDWLNLVSAWWLRHRYYPPQAGANFEEGDVTLHMRVDHDGRVENLELTGKSGSGWLDLGALSVFRGAFLPPLPPDMPEKQIPFEVTVHYMIVR